MAPKRIKFQNIHIGNRNQKPAKNDQISFAVIL